MASSIPCDAAEPSFVLFFLHSAPSPRGPANFSRRKRPHFMRHEGFAGRRVAPSRRPTDATSTSRNPCSKGSPAGWAINQHTATAADEPAINNISFP